MIRINTKCYFKILGSHGESLDYCEYWNNGMCNRKGYSCIARTVYDVLVENNIENSSIKEIYYFIKELLKDHTLVLSKYPIDKVKYKWFSLKLYGKNMVYTVKKAKDLINISFKLKK